MRKLWVGIGGALFCAVAQAQDSVKAVFVPAKNGDAAKVIDLQTGSISKVLGTFEAAPQDCPPGSYWVMNDVSVVSCADGSEYKFGKLDPSIEAPFAAMALKPVIPEDDETREPGPHIQGGE